MKILVTGWNGINNSFIPRSVAQHLIQCGHEVHGWEWDTMWTPDWQTIYGWVYDEELKRYMPTDPTGDRHEPSPLHTYDLVIHLGAISSTSEKNLKKVMLQNFDFSLWLLNQCQHYNIPLHYASSASVYGNTTHFQEDGPMDPKTPYAWSKYLFDRIILENANRFKSSVVGFRYFNVYSFDREQHKGNQASFASKLDLALANTTMPEMFEGSDKILRDFVYIDDVCKVHEHLLDIEHVGILNVGTGIATSFESQYEKFNDFSGLDINIVPIPKELECSYQNYTCADNYLLMQHLPKSFKWTTFDEAFDNYFYGNKYE